MQKSSDLQHSYEMARKHLEALSGLQDSNEVFQLYDDLRGREPVLPPLVLTGTLKQHWSTLVAMNLKGYAVSVTVNQTDLKGRRDKNIVRVRALITDDDDQKNIEIGINPSFSVQPARGPHNYYLVSNVGTDEFKALNKKLIEYTQTDMGINKLCHPMRLAGFYHMKNPASPIMVKFIDGSSTVYDKKIFLDKFAENNDVKSFNATTKTKAKTNSIEKLRRYIQNLPIDEGMRNESILKFCREGLGLGVSEDILKAEIKNFCDISGEDLDKSFTTLKYQLKYHAEDPFTSFSENEFQTNNEIAKSIITDSREPSTGEATYCTVSSVLHKYDNGKYSPIKDNFDLILRKKLNTLNHKKISQNKILEIIKEIKAETLCDTEKTNNFFLDRRTNDRYLAMNTHIINLNKIIKNEVEVELISPKFFTTSKLPFDFIQNADCPIFKKILSRILPDPEDQKMLQVWFGYHLLETVAFGKFLICIGSGANGKSLILLVLRLFLGKENVSSVPVEGFNNKRTFGLALTYGKLANICDEMPSAELDVALFKNYVTGGMIMAEVKYHNPFSFSPTAKLTFSTNIMPEVKDRSDGFWRRLLVLSFNEKIPESEQTPLYLDENFWINSGELSGIFNWAIEGTKNIIQNNHIFESPSSKMAVQKTKIEADNARLWISENIKFQQGAFLPRPMTYRAYRQDILDQGLKPCNDQEFKIEIEKAFPLASFSANPVSTPFNGRVRGWHNLICTPDTAL